ncbi:DUF2252 domain-containing protein [Microbacterium sp. I2]|jgi:uncharacterized protein (DUF2252 family)|uniref:DUF2252 domain-containing protein n=1 Tax=Microbacterium sp. I2 TaxID=3391826 RepID=UPI003ED8DCD6
MSTTSDRPTTVEAWTAPPSLAEHLALGRAERTRVPRESLAEVDPAGRDPLAILDAQDSTRVPELVPLRAERMAASPFAFYRGTAALMAADLSRSPATGLHVGSCGDAHVSNFGLYASPQRTLVFDLNDFDEAAWAPWEWDLKRLATSVVIAGQSTSRDETVVRDAALGAVRTYVRAMGSRARRDPLERYFEHFDANATSKAEDRESREALRKAIKDAEKRTAVRAARRLTTRDARGRVRFLDQPPTMTHVDPTIEGRIAEVLEGYTRSANVDIRVLLQNYVVSDVAQRVVGVGSVGTRCYLIAMMDGDGNVLLLQVKEANASVLIEHGGVTQPASVSRYINDHGDGGRVVAMQRILQGVSDPFLGHLRGTAAGGGASRAFYLRQFHDKKGGFDTDTLEDAAFRWYAEACGATLARAHGQSPGASSVVGYVGGGRVVGEAILEWAYSYADLSRGDWRSFRRHRGIDRAG